MFSEGIEMKRFLNVLCTLQFTPSVQRVWSFVKWHKTFYQNFCICMGSNCLHFSKFIPQKENNSTTGFFIFKKYLLNVNKDELVLKMNFTTNNSEQSLLSI